MSGDGLEGKGKMVSFVPCHPVSIRGEREELRKLAAVTEKGLKSFRESRGIGQESWGLHSCKMQ